VRDRIVRYCLPVDVLPLDQQVCFALYTAGRAVTARYRPLLDELGITYPQYLVLLALWERDERTVKDLGTALRLDSSTLSPLLKRLEAAGLVLRERRTDDERSVTIRLTGTGSAMRARASAIPARLLCADGLDLHELADLRETLVRLTTALNNAALSNAALSNAALNNAALNNAALNNAVLTNASPIAPPLTTEGDIDAGALHG
jgi:DNA-binding MarR family transcriptional regulator